ncbi:gastrula zinc finger protein XlCGF57.1-like [Cebidichthys violaceus]|uniref:gastrula zinc finger protein XlCGF57.1-like n=1 Tax=Cebidichthys violaceus TaxID=271503 RepID=UPI0035CADA4D
MLAGNGPVSHVKMSKVQMLRCLVNQRLTAAAEEIFGVFERTIAEYEEELCRSKEENERQRKLLDAVFNPQLRLHRADVQQLLVVKDEQQEWSSSLDQQDPEPPHIKEEQEDPEPPHIKEEQEELCTSQEGEQFQGLEETDIKFSFTPVKSEHDEEEAQFSQLHQRQTEQMETEAGVEDCGGPEPGKNSDPERHSEPNTDGKTGDSSESKTENSGDWKETREPQSGLNSLNNDNISVSDSRCSAGEKLLSCSECGKRFFLMGDFKKHMRIHTREKTLICSVCNKSFSHSGALHVHMRCHTGEKPFSCSVCNKSFSRNGDLQVHMRCHTGEKPFNCSVCNKSFSRNGDLQVHMRCHTGEKPFSCSVCNTSFTQSGHLQRHMVTHTGEKPFSCSVCDKRFVRNANLKVHMVIHTGENPLYAHTTRLGLPDVQQLLVVKDEQQEWSSSLDQQDPEPPHIKEEQEDPEPPHIKEEQEELCTSQEGEQFQGLEETDIKFSFTPVKSEHDEEEAQFSQLHQRQTEQMETEAGVEDCGGPEPGKNSDPERHSEPNTDGKTGDSSESKTENSGDWKETREPQSGLNSLNNDNISVSDSRCSAGEKLLSCSECGKRFFLMGDFKKHMRIHTREKTLICSVCNKSFSHSGASGF